MNQQEFNREAILVASDERLNQWAAEKIRGWWLEPGESGENGAMPFFAVWRDKNGLLRHIQTNYTPSTDIAQAMALLPLAGANWSIEGDKYESNFRCSIKTSGNPARWISRAGGSLPRAITIAALLAVAAMEGKDEPQSD